ncbi:MAG TPA: tRNA (adenosine(37)-N6)-threonylcarbamoyltransferase complex ATPase subunit type 1 TsaE [Woeseiaceae bacterium]|nr:tRNA (adenosine(37)-N6)-threonylcarbamoyltransferase complex ATPase subunit type 1 TsaE [Woeseiaceae bacterium]
MAESLTATLDLPDARATEALGQQLARHLPEDTRGFMILLEGELGSGKSTLARAMLRALGHRGPVPSPTYTLVEPYTIGGRTVYHVDLYRLTDGGELPYLGWTEMDDGLMLVEWPERAPSLAARGDLIVRLRYLGTGRAAEVVAQSPRGRALLRPVMS